MQMILDLASLNLPQKIANKMHCVKIVLTETDNGILIQPLEDVIKKSRGILKNSGFTTDKYLLQKKSDKELE